MSTDIVIVNWNSGDYLCNCIKSIQLNCPTVNQVIVVDNNSSDASLSNLPFFKKLKILKEDVNHGFAKGCNIGFEHSSAKFTLFLNPDTVFLENSVQMCEKFMELKTSQNIAVCGIKQINANGIINRHSGNFPKPLQFIAASLGINRIWYKSAFIMSDWDHNSSCFVPHVIGSFYFIRREIFKELRGFDENFFLYYEDLDLSKRINLYGKKIYYLSETKIIHNHGGCSQNIKTQRNIYSFISRSKYAKKHFNKIAYITCSIFIFIFEPIIRILNACFSSNPIKNIRIEVALIPLLLRYFFYERFKT